MHEPNSYLPQVRTAITRGLMSGTREFFLPTVLIARWIGHLIVSLRSRS